MKTCCSCKKELPLDNFRKNKATKDGLAKPCKTCEKIYRDKNKEKIKLSNKNCYLKNKEHRKALMKAYYLKNKQKLNAYRKQWALTNFEKEYQYRKKAAEKGAHKKAAYVKRRCMEDPLFKLKVESRLLVRRAVVQNMSYAQNRLKNEFNVDYLEIREVIESRFKPGMTWDNHGEWHIDHIIPLFSAKNEEEVKELLRPENMQPLWKRENLLKGKN